MLPNNTKCEWCGKEFRMKPHYIARKARENKPVTCSRSCAMNLASSKRKAQKILDYNDLQLDRWKQGYNQCLSDYGLRS